VLRKLKDAITADPTGFLEGCGQEDVCEWAGVTCSQYTREHQTVTQLNWAQHQLGGTLPTRALNQLTRLQALYLHGNQLHGALPAFHTWPKLKGIYLQDNLLTGTLPRRVAKLTNLQARHPPPPTCQPHEHNNAPASRFELRMYMYMYSHGAHAQHHRHIRVLRAGDWRERRTNQTVA